MAPGLVIYQAGEGRRGIKKRFRAWRQYNGITPGTRIPIYILQARIDIYSADGDTGKLIAECKGIAAMYDMPLRAIFIDTLAKAQGSADENSGKDMSVVMGNVDKISEALPGVHVGLVHHFNAAGTKIRGHSSVYAGLDQVIVVTKDENSKVKTAVLDKQKDDVDDQQIRFELMQIEIGKRAVDGRPITSCVTIPVGGVPIEAPGAKKPYTIKLTNERAVILAALRDALAEHGEAPPPAMKLPRAITRVTRVKYWKDEYLKKAPDGGNADNTINKRMSMASAQFQHLRIIGRNNPFVWLTGRGVAGVITTVPDMPAETAPDGAVDGTDDVPMV